MRKSMSKKDESKETAALDLEPETTPIDEKPAEKKQSVQPKKSAEPETLTPVEKLAMDADIPAWELAGLMRAAGWAGGKQVTKTGFDKALAAFRNRGQGRGRIAVEE
jgi:hypothetical protein